MGNIKLIFNGSEKSKTEDAELICYANTLNEIYLSVKEDGYPKRVICLDIDSAVKFVKHLKREIAIIKNNENYL